jgi:glycosyltransferase
MRISAITACYNSRSTIENTIQSFLRQSHPDKELLVIDGGSTDGTLEILKRFNDSAIRVISEADKGIYDAMNKGLANYVGDAIGFLNSDDAYHDETSLVKIAEALEKSDAVYGDLDMVRDHVTKKVVREWRAGDFTPGAFRNGWMPPHPTCYLRRGLVEKTGAFDLGYRISADYDFMLRAFELHRPCVRYIPHVLVDFMVGGASTSGPFAVIRGNLECLKSRQRYLGAPILDSAFVLKPLRKLTQVI